MNVNLNNKYYLTLSYPIQYSNNALQMISIIIQNVKQYHPSRFFHDTQP